MQTARRWCVVLALIAGNAPSHSASAEPPPATAPALGSISGVVTDSTGRPVELASVNLVGMHRGVGTDEQGHFTMLGVPAGRVQIQVVAMGYPKLTRTVEVTAARVTTIALRLGAATTVARIPVIIVRPRTSPIDKHDSGTNFHYDRQKFEDSRLDNVSEFVALTPGIVAIGTELFVRGGRPDELKTRVGEVMVSNLLAGGDGMVANLAVERIDVHTGGFDAEYGGALSGIVDVTTREGGESFAGTLRWDTDRYGDARQTFDNFDRFAVGFGGPTPIRRLTYFATYEGTYSDTYLRTSQTQTRRTVFDFIQLGNRQSNQVNTNLKLAYRPNPRDKVTLETIRNRSINTPYEHMWSREGYVQVTLDTVHVAGEPDILSPRFGSWSATQRDSTDQPVNMPDHVPTIDDRYRQLTAAWTRQISNRTAWTTRMSSLEFDTRVSVGHREPWQYEVQPPFYWNGNTGTGTEDNPYFATHGDFPRFARRHATIQTLKSDFMTRHWHQHAVKTGIEVAYNHVSNLGLTLPNVETNGLPGGNRSDFTNYNPEWSGYVQDRWEFEGMVLNVGLRYDAFTPGAQIDDADLRSGKRFKQQVSPRLGVAFPVSDRDVLSFHYGWTYQTPDRSAIFENRGAGTTVNTRGNPDLDAETNVAYQAAVQHLFSRDVSGQFAVFFRDIYGLITARQERDSFGNLVTVFSNGDYASARGFEASLIKSFSHRFSADVNYTYSLATGVASDPAQALQFFNGGRLYLPISEMPLRWDQRHTLSFSTTIREPGHWGMHALWSYGSGLPYTPAFRNDRRADPRLENGRRLPSRASLSVDGDKYFRIWGRGMTLFFDAKNVLDATNIANLSPNDAAFLNPNLNAAGDDYAIYYTETGRAGGAYLQDTNGDGTLDWVPVHDPRVLEEGRRVRLGLAMAF